VRVDELEGAVRTICEPYFSRPLSEVSLGEVLMKLFSLAHKYELIVQPQLLLLQKRCSILKASRARCGRSWIFGARQSRS